MVSLGYVVGIGWLFIDLFRIIGSENVRCSGEKGS